jgi:two-component system NtrC family sensor kinase
MKKSLGILLLFLPLTIFAQLSEVFKIDSLPKQGLLLNKDWKFKLGDNPDFAKADFDDATWQPINPILDIFDLPQLPKTGEIFWLRLHIEVDSSLNQQMLMTVQQSGASEVFMNGKLIQKLGVVSTNPDEIKAYNPYQRIFAFPIQQANAQVLALRYVFQPTMRYATHFANTNVAFSITLFSPENWYEENAFKQYAYDVDVVLGSIYAVLCILYLAFYLFFSKRKTSLYFTIYTFLYTLPYFINGFLLNLDIGNRYWLSNTFIIMGIVASSFLLLSVYRLFASKISIFYWLILLFGIICIPLAFIFYVWGWTVYGMGYNLLVSFEILRIAVRGIIKHKKGAWIIATGGFVFFFFWFLFLFGANVLGTQYAPYFYAIAQLGIPLSVAMFLGYDFAQTNLSLQQKLIENEILATEKQQILATQNETLERQVEARTAELKASQNQLIQKEKLASLGELTAGIAHEIQNPLNFVNNFSSVNSELADELNQELDKGDIDAAKAISKDIKDNSEKINHHGKRADGIVKGMLQHSQKSTGAKEPTDINALADEYLRLSFHGLRAKDKLFNATLNTSYDPAIGNINIIPQNIGRVLMNLYNNAFYAVAEKQKTSSGDYQPTVSISTKKKGDTIELTVCDNGNGIPVAIKEKIFQPFFTTKPTGQGTGLGLSLSYDIVKAHGGEIRVETKESEGSVFRIQLSNHSSK